jgi:hypothetical protein
MNRCIFLRKCSCTLLSNSSKTARRPFVRARSSRLNKGVHTSSEHSDPNQLVIVSNLIIVRRMAKPVESWMEAKIRNIGYGLTHVGANLYGAQVPALLRFQDRTQSFYNMHSDSGMGSHIPTLFAVTSSIVCPLFNPLMEMARLAVPPEPCLRR